MIITSYYQKAKVGDLSISVGNFRYARFPISKILELTPLSVIGKDWARLSDEEYIYLFKRGLLKLNPCEVLQKIKNGKNEACILCFEKFDKFCHRHIIASWLNNELGEPFVERDLPKGYVFNKEKFLYEKKIEEERCLNLWSE